jgi:hypothetical protein
MKIEKSEDGKNYKFYETKTWKYLVPCLRVYGDEFVDKWSFAYKVALGIFDYSVKDVKKYQGDNIYCLIDINKNSDKFEEFIEYIKLQPFYTGHYPFKKLESGLVMVVIKIPEVFKETYNLFLQGKYSQMYTKDIIDKIFPIKTKQKQRDVLLKSKEGFKSFQQTFYDFMEMEIDDINVAEYDLPLINKEEIFNFNKDKPVFFDIKDKIW